jgi:hypothetical protein
MTDIDPEAPAVVLVHPDWCMNQRPDHDHGTHHASMGDVRAQGRGEVSVRLTQTLGARPFVELASARGDTPDYEIISLYLSARQAVALGRRLLDAATTLREG